MSSPTSHPAARRGALAATGCYILWGLLPIYWKHLESIDATQLIAHRYVWSLLLALAIMAATGGLGELRAALGSRAALRWHGASGLLLTVNWLVYVWAVNAGHIVETSLGYFLVPLVNVAFGRFLLREHLRPVQWLAIACAAAGVVVLLLRVGRLPWIALTLAGTWGAYGLLRKQSPLGPLTGLGLETLLLSPFALAYILWRQANGTGVVGHASAPDLALLLCVGLITVTPLLLFVYGARRIRFSTLGLLQYIAPSVQLAIGLWLYHEEFSPGRAAAFAFIWCGLALYTADNLWTQRKALVGAT